MCYGAIWKAPKGTLPEEMNELAWEEMGRVLEVFSGDEDIYRSVKLVINRMGEWVRRPVAMESIAAVGYAEAAEDQFGVRISFIFPDESRDIGNGEKVYAGISVHIGRPPWLPEDRIRVKLGRSVWVQTCTNGAGYWTNEFEMSPDWPQHVRPVPPKAKRRPFDAQTPATGDNGGPPGPGG